MYNVKVEYESTPIRRIAVQCPYCDNWYHGWAITDSDLRYDSDIRFAEFTCPICNKSFGGWEDAEGPKIEEISDPKIYEKCLKKMEVWY